MELRAAVCESLCLRDIMRMTVKWFIKWFLVITFEMFSLTKKRRSKEDVGEYSGDKRYGLLVTLGTLGTYLKWKINFTGLERWPRAWQYYSELIVNFSLPDTYSSGPGPGSRGSSASSTPCASRRSLNFDKINPCLLRYLSPLFHMYNN